MKAAVCYEFGKPLVIEDIEIDPPQAGAVKVRLAACAICYSDIHYMEGAWGRSAILPFSIYAIVTRRISAQALPSRICVSSSSVCRAMLKRTSSSF